MRKTTQLAFIGFDCDGNIVFVKQLSIDLSCDSSFGAVKQIVSTQLNDDSSLVRITTSQSTCLEYTLKSICKLESEIKATLILTTHQKLILNLLVDGCGLKSDEIKLHIGGSFESNMEAIKNLEKMKLIHKDKFYNYCAAENAIATISSGDTYSIRFTGGGGRQNFDTAKELEKVAVETGGEGNGYLISMLKDGQRFMLTEDELTRHARAESAQSS